MNKKVSMIAAVLLATVIGTTGFAQEAAAQDVTSIVTENVTEPMSDAGDTAVMQYIQEISSQPTSGAEQLMPMDIKVINENGVALIIKTFEVTPDYNLELLVEDDFEQGGYAYTKRDILRAKENYVTDTKLASKMVTVEHDNKEGIIARFQPLLDYRENGYEGQLELDMNAIVTEAAGSQSYAYTISDTREYSGFYRNDTYGIPKTVEKNGVTLTLDNVEWSGMGATPVAGNAAAPLYTAIAHYTGSATGTRTSAYTSTAVYKGEVTKKTLESVVFAIVYEGTIIPLPPIPPNYIPLIVGATAVILLAVFAILWVFRRNARVYAYNDGKYFLIKKVRIEYGNPLVDLSNMEYATPHNQFYIVIDRFAARRLNGRIIKITRKGLQTIEHYVDNNGSHNEYEIQVTYSPCSDSLPDENAAAPQTTEQEITEAVDYLESAPGSQGGQV